MKKVIINLATIYLEKKLFKMKITRNININLFYKKILVCSTYKLSSLLVHRLCK